MIGHFEGTITGSFQEKVRGEFRLVPGKVLAKPDLEKYCLRFLVVILSIILIN